MMSGLLLYQMLSNQSNIIISHRFTKVGLHVLPKFIPFKILAHTLKDVHHSEIEIYKFLDLRGCHHCGTVPKACFLFLARSKLRLCSANHRSGYWSNLPCDWRSTAWAYFEQETENGPWSACSSYASPLSSHTSVWSIVSGKQSCKPKLNGSRTPKMRGRLQYKQARLPASGNSIEQVRQYRWLSTRLW